MTEIEAGFFLQVVSLTMLLAALTMVFNIFIFSESANLCIVIYKCMINCFGYLNRCRKLKVKSVLQITESYSGSWQHFDLIFSVFSVMLCM